MEFSWHMKIMKILIDNYLALYNFFLHSRLVNYFEHFIPNHATQNKFH